MAEEAKDEINDDPGGDQARAIAVFAIYFTLPAVALVALPVTLASTASTRRCSGCPRTRAASPGDPIAGRGAQPWTSACCSSPAEIYVGILAATILFLATNAGPDRRLAARLLDGHPPPVARPAAPAAPEVPHAVDRDHRLRRRRDPRSRCPGQATFLGNLYAFGAMLSFTIAHLAVIRLRISKPDFPRPYRAPGNVSWRGRDCPLFAVARRLRHRARVRRDRRPAPRRRRHPASAGWRSAWSSTCSTGAGRGWT